MHKKVQNYSMQREKNKYLKINRLEIINKAFKSLYYSAIYTVYLYCLI